MTYLKAVALAIIEGATEFLPVSSTGHLILAEEFIRLSTDESFTKTFIVAIQLPAVLSVVVYFWRDIVPGPERTVRQIVALWSRVAAAVLPAVVLGVLFDDAIEALLGSPIPVAVALMIGGIAILLIDRPRAHAKVTDVRSIGYGRAVAIGFFQCLAMIPGTSRSAATIIGAILLGCSRPAAAEFSFFLAIPTMLGATSYTLAKHGLAFTGEQWAVLAVGSAASFLTAYAVVAWLMRYIQTHDFRPFGWYRIVLGLVVLAYFLSVGYYAATPAP